MKQVEGDERETKVKTPHPKRGLEEAIRQTLSQN
jgi:hypothetical protein